MKDRKESGTTRRGFLGVTGAALLAGRASLRGFAQESETSGEGAHHEEGNAKIRLAVVGGGFGASHHWHEHPDCEVTAVTVLVEDRRQNLVRAYGCENVFPSLEEMLERAPDDFDAVAIFTDAPSHAPAPSEPPGST